LQPPPWDCVADWSVAFALPATVRAPAALVWFTSPLSSRLKIRTSRLLLGATCVAVAFELADCWLEVSAGPFEPRGAQQSRGRPATWSSTPARVWCAVALDQAPEDHGRSDRFP